MLASNIPMSVLVLFATGHGKKLYSESTFIKSDVQMPFIPLQYVLGKRSCRKPSNSCMVFFVVYQEKVLMNKCFKTIGFVQRYCSFKNASTGFSHSLVYMANLWLGTTLGRVPDFSVMLSESSS